MRPLIKINRIPSIDFMSMRNLGFALSLILTIGSLALFFTRGLNYGIDFSGGTIIEARTSGPADLATMRSQLDGLGLGDVSLQNFGSPDDVLIRLQQPTRRRQGAGAGRRRAGEAEARRRRRIPPHRGGFGPTVGAELIKAGTEATVLALHRPPPSMSGFASNGRSVSALMLSTLHEHHHHHRPVLAFAD